MCRRVIAVLFAAVAVAVFLSPAFAADTLRPGAAELYPTWNAVGIQLSYQGDDNADASASFTWRLQGEETWRNGVDMARDTSRRLWGASIFPLEQGQTVEVKISFADPDGMAEGASAQMTETVQTRVMVTETSGGRQLVVAADGSGDFQTISEAVKDLKAGDTLTVAAGVYREQVDIGAIAGTAEQPIVIAGEGDGKTVVDASVTIPIGAAWSDEENGIYSIALKSAKAVTLVFQDGRRVYGYTSPQAFANDVRKAGRALFYDEKAQRLYVKTGSSKAASECEYAVGQAESAFVLDGSSHVVIKDFDMRHACDAAVRMKGGADSNTIMHNNILDCGLALSINDTDCDNNAFWNNNVKQVGQTDYTWGMLMSEHGTFARDGLYLWTGRGTSIVGNRIDGHHNLITLEPYPGEPQRVASTTLVGNRDLDIMNNVLLNGSDDAVEGDYGGVNMRVYHNHSRNANSGVSFAPCVRGPVYIVRNDFTFRTVMFKFGIGSGTSHGACCCYHNSGYNLAYTKGLGIYFNAKLPTSNKVFLNNILGLTGSDAMLAMRPDNVVDYNCYWRPGGNLQFQWKSTWCRSLDRLRALGGVEEHGIIADPVWGATPGYGKYGVANYNISTATGAGLVENIADSDFSLQPGSPCIDAGVVIRGINEDFAGKAPDMGAIESGAAQ